MLRIRLNFNIPFTLRVRCRSSTDLVNREAFSQEDSFANGVGLGLSIVRQITSSLGGHIDLQSTQGKGTKLKISLTVPISSAPHDDSKDPIKVVSQRVNGLTLCILDPGHDMTGSPDTELKKRAEDTFRRLITTWFGMKVLQANSVAEVEADFFIYIEPPSTDYILQKHGGAASAHVPIIIVTSNAYESANLRKDTQSLREIGRTIDIISQPCGPQKLAKAFERCIYQEPYTEPTDIANASLAAMRIDGENEEVPPPSSHNQDTHTSEAMPSPIYRPSKLANALSELARSRPGSDIMAEAVSVSGGGSISGLSMSHFPPSESFDEKSDLPGEAPERIIRPVLLVDDNDVNLKLLVAFVRKARMSYATAQDGLQALELYKSASKDPSRAFRVVVMDIQMPLMDGLSATREIRNFEAKNRIHPPVTVVALTGLASSSSQHEAFEAGVDHFLPKPVKFKEFLKFLEL
jgi:CheY-like chemotaxis protein